MRHARIRASICTLHRPSSCFVLVEPLYQVARQTQAALSISNTPTASSDGFSGLDHADALAGFLRPALTLSERTWRGGRGLEIGRRRGTAFLIQCKVRTGRREVLRLLTRVQLAPACNATLAIWLS
jgi:hypothetical protein